MHFLLWIKGSLESTNFDTFQLLLKIIIINNYYSLMKIYQIPHVIFQTTS